MKHKKRIYFLVKLIVVLYILSVFKLDISKTKELYLDVTAQIILLIGFLYITLKYLQDKKSH